MQPLHQPSTAPSRLPSQMPSAQPVYGRPTCQPSLRPTLRPSTNPTPNPSSQPLAIPSSQPIGTPSEQPRLGPSLQPLGTPSFQPVSFPTIQPSDQLIENPSTQHGFRPTNIPTLIPLAKPSWKPTHQPVNLPNRLPYPNPPLILLQESITLESLRFSMLTLNDKIVLQQSIRAAVANVTEIPISFISTPNLSSSVSSLDTVDSHLRATRSGSMTQTHSIKSQPRSVKLTGGVIATSSIIGDRDRINTALHHANSLPVNSSASGDNLAGLCSVILNSNGGNTLLSAIRIQVNNVKTNNSTETSVSSLLTLLANATITKVTVLVLSPTAAPSRGPPTPGEEKPSSTPEPSPSSLNIGEYIGIALGAVVFVLSGGYLLYKRWFCKSSAIQKELDAKPEEEFQFFF